MMTGLYVLLALTVLAVSSIIYHGMRNGITPMPSSLRAAEAMMRAAEEEVRRMQPAGAAHTAPLILEAGSGWGGVAVGLAHRLPDARIIGYENSPVPYLFSLLRKRAAGSGNLELRCGNFRSADFAAVDIVVCYLYPGGMRQIAGLIGGLPTVHKSSRESGPVPETGDGTGSGSAPTVISNTFTLPGRTPDRTIQSGDASLSPVYVYRPRVSAG
jgi:hypothetical protein